MGVERGALTWSRPPCHGRLQDGAASRLLWVTGEGLALTQAGRKGISWGLAPQPDASVKAKASLAPGLSGKTDTHALTHRPGRRGSRLTPLGHGGGLAAVTLFTDVVVKQVNEKNK